MWVLIPAFIFWKKSEMLGLFALFRYGLAQELYLHSGSV